MKKTLLAGVTISLAAFAYASSSSSDSSALVSQQCKISAEAVSTLKGLQYGNASIRKDVASLIERHLKMPENKEIAYKKLNMMVDDRSSDVATLESKYCS